MGLERGRFIRNGSARIAVDPKDNSDWTGILLVENGR